MLLCDVPHCLKKRLAKHFFLRGFKPWTQLTDEGCSSCAPLEAHRSAWSLHTPSPHAVLCRGLGFHSDSFPLPQTLHGLMAPRELMNTVERGTSCSQCHANFLDTVEFPEKTKLELGVF